MLTEELMYDVLRHFAFNPTDDQMFAADIFSRFMTDRDERCVMILRGSAGTGKTSLAGAIVRTMDGFKAEGHTPCTYWAGSKSVLAEFGTTCSNSPSLYLS